MPCSACGGEGPREERGAESQGERREREGAVEELEHRLEMERRDAAVEEVKERIGAEISIGARLGKFILRGLMVLLWVYVFDSMRRYAINYIGGDTWFSTFAVIVVAVPIAEVFCILGQTFTRPRPKSLPLARCHHRRPCKPCMPCNVCACACGTGADGEAPREELDTPLLDVEKVPGHDHTVADAREAEVEMAIWRIMRCIFRGLLVLPWVYLVDLMRRYVATYDYDILSLTVFPLSLLLAGISIILVILMEINLDGFFPPPT